MNQSNERHLLKYAKSKSYKIHNFLPISCKTKCIKLDVSIWNRLFKTNSWIYCTHSEFVTLNCNNPQKSFQFNIKGIGRLSIAPSCTLHTTTAIMSPILNTFVNNSLDLVPENPLFNISKIKELDIDDINPQTLNHFGLYKNFRQAIRESTIEQNPIIKQQKTC
ncbi:Envelope fusion protein [Aphis craccivora]|uniref:Envelope fusion protein n=1 Tax=Aphis craccivora TaxID=307492 RepID=A0A6G0VRN7_APHCR|nr:Envelope fusion protein [Aphis craccivora]